MKKMIKFAAVLILTVAAAVIPASVSGAAEAHQTENIGVVIKRLSAGYANVHTTTVTKTQRGHIRTGKFEFELTAKGKGPSMTVRAHQITTETEGYDWFEKSMEKYGKNAAPFDFCRIDDEGKRAEFAADLTVVVNIPKDYQKPALYHLKPDGTATQVVLTGSKDAFRFVMDKSGYYVLVDKKDIPADPEEENPFLDVSKKDYFYDAVIWALEHNITAGQTPDKFAPFLSCSRAEIVTFLYRVMAGMPSDLECQFTDISEDDFYYEAMMWAVEKGITTGTSATTFSPYELCTREQIVTFLWRAVGEPEAEQKVDFNDMDTQEYYYPAIRWAVESGVTTGQSAELFGVYKSCFRGDCVLFMQRALGE